MEKEKFIVAVSESPRTNKTSQFSESQINNNFPLATG